MTPTFRQLLERTTDTAERPRALAAGHYLGFIKGHEFGKSAKKGTPSITFLLTATDETEDVPEGENEGVDFAKKTMRKTLYITPDSLYRLADTLDAILGKQSGRTYDERITATKNARVMFKVTVRTSDDGENVYNDVDTIVAVDE